MLRPKSVVKQSTLTERFSKEFGGCCCCLDFPLNNCMNEWCGLLESFESLVPSVTVVVDVAAILPMDDEDKAVGGDWPPAEVTGSVDSTKV
jgi:hypothetical protein